MMDFVAAAFDLSGLYAIGNKRRFGFLISILADIVWMYIGLMARLYGLVTIASVALVLNVRNYRQWAKLK